MLSPAFQSPKAAVSAVAFGSVSVYCFFKLYYDHLSPVGSGDEIPALCGSESNWDASLGNDCFRTGFLWPALLLLFGGISALSFCLCLVLPARSGENGGFTTDGSSPFSRLSVGNTLVPARRPPGITIVVDNRLRIGTWTVVLLAVQTMFYYMWTGRSAIIEVNGTKDYLFSGAMASLSAIVLLLSSVCLAALWRSNRLMYSGIFPSVLPAAVGLQLTFELCEVYFSFFTDENAHVPIIGTNASTRSNLLVLTTVLNLGITFLFFIVQHGPIFYRPIDNAQSTTSQQDPSIYSTLAESDNDDTSCSIDDFTPLSHGNDQKPSKLITSPEHNCSWYDTLTFSWTSELLVRGTKATVDYSDLYNLRPEDTPLSHWNRYLRYRKPGRSLITTLLLTYWPQLTLHLTLTFIYCLTDFANPFFLQRILRFIEMSSVHGLSSIENTRSKYLDVLGLFVFTIFHTLLFNQYLWLARRLTIWLKGLFVAELTAKTLCRSGKGTFDDDKKKKDKKNKKAGSKDKDDTKEDSADSSGKVMNLLTADFNEIIHASFYIFNIYDLVIKLAIGIWYMYSLIGASALVGIAVTILYIPLSKAILTRYKKITAQQSAAGDKRITAITEVIHGIKAIKLFGWESRFIAKVDERREQQLSYMWKKFFWSTILSASANLNPIIILVIMFASYVVVFGNTLNAGTAFTSIIIFQMVRSAVAKLPSSIGYVVGAYVAFTRVDSYLGQSQIQELEKRIPAQGSSSELGFDCADLEWNVSDSSTADAENANSNTSDMSRRTDSNTNSQTTENTPLLAATTSGAQSSLSVRSSATQIANQEEIMRFSLKDVDVRFPLGQLSIVAGPTGSGKSSLLSALIGEMTLVRGRVLLPTISPSALAETLPNYRDIIKLSREGATIHDIVYVAQEAWLRNATIRENILFGEPYDLERYEEVLRICALKPDLRILAAGDMSEVGERGIALSGGQKQRVALARAVYSSRRILLIDDCLSAVDAHTSKHILVECLSGNSRIMQGRTRVLVTHHVAMCLPYAQYMVMVNGGRIALKGTPAELRNSNSLSSALIESLDNKNNESAMKQNNKENTTSVNDRRPEDEYNKEHLQKLAAKRGIDPNTDLSILQGVLIKDEEREIGYVKFEVWKMFMKTCGSYMFWAYLIMILLASEAITALRSYWIKMWVESTNSSAPGLNTAIGGRVSLARDMHKLLIRKIVHAVPKFHDTTTAGRIINRFSRDMSVIDDGALDSIGHWFSRIISVLAIYFIVTAVIPAFAIAAIVITSIFAVITFYYLNTTRELKRLEANSMSALLSLFGEIIQGATTIRSFGAKHYYIKEAINRINSHNRPFYVVWSSNRWLLVRINAASSLVAASAATFILYNLDHIDAGMAGFLLTYALTFADEMLWVIRDYSDNEMNMTSIERIMQYTRTEQEAANESDSQNKPPATWPTKGDMQINDLVVEYVPGVPVLHGISLSVEHGEKVGVVGRTGAGKSTISLALLRFLEASKGQIVLDGIDISKIGLEDLRRNVTIIPQDPVLFNGTIRFNLDPFDEHPDELLWEALRRTHLVREAESQANSTAASIANANDTENKDMVSLERMSGIFTTLDAEIKENGSNLSAGQRQLVALARALVRRSKLIIMDEATASVDFDTDRRIQNTIQGPEFANSTLLCIAHRLRTVIDYDKVLVLDNGRVAEFDTPHNLLQKEDGIFRSMCEKAGEYKRMIKAEDSKN
ncbi:hypothetical protein IWW48_001974 [Coemansia sp. RSA 1200]|nr:hypothetical protein IWW48_001974 [Coemansia sp. RSA 1200]